ncbi:uncharacterized protein [Aristolochia californica]|uniref:uncharacterized protein n=1 Tax=Aristolochia californica TaxID=171875 RepID=UPI0035DE66F3
MPDHRSSMEFRYRAGDENPYPCYLSGGDSYFTPQAWRASYVAGGDFRRPDSLLNSHVPCLSSREAIRRELEKERIREEIIAREILLRRELEEEVRRELALEREFALRRQADRFAFASSSSLLSERGATLPPLVDTRIGERSLIASHRSHEVGSFGRLSTELQPEPTVSEIKSINEFDRMKSVTSLVTGTKREPASGNELAWLSNVNSKMQKEWSCALCQVSATCKEGLNEHLQGKKHRAKEAELKGSKKGGEPTTELTALTEKKAPSPAGKDENKVLPNPEPSDDRKQQKQKTVRSRDGKQPLRKRQKTEGGGKSRLPLVCELCNIKCYSQTVLRGHYEGRKHKARVIGNGNKVDTIVSLNGKKDVEGQILSVNDEVQEVEEGHNKDEKVEATDDSKGNQTMELTNNEAMPGKSTWKLI